MRSWAASVLSADVHTKKRKDRRRLFLFDENDFQTGEYKMFLTLRQMKKRLMEYRKSIAYELVRVKGL